MTSRPETIALTLNAAAGFANVVSRIAIGRVSEPIPFIGTGRWQYYISVGDIAVILGTLNWWATIAVDMQRRWSSAPDRPVRRCHRRAAPRPPPP